MNCDDFDTHEITDDVKFDYVYIAEKTEKNPVSKSQSSLKSPLILPESATLTMDEDENPDGELLREQTPTFPESVFESLPDLLHAGLKYITDPRERDMLLLAMITVISSLLHRVTAYYARKRYWPNLYCFVVAASNKGVLEYALTI